MVGWKLNDSYLFAYGTLRKKAGANEYLRYAQYSADGFFNGVLYEVNGYPGAVTSDNENDRVAVEVYRLLGEKKIFTLLDEYEECAPRYPASHEYIRKCISVHIIDKGIVHTWIYLYNRDVSKLTRIASGNYLDYIKNM
ncbi:MAG: gamma-glutamylcyclotransferase [Spirochaetales bacterium]|nr:gamma-glutamylcyclotransferase [Spirochaetales bacterium]